jgi:hypothetical protein
VEVLGCRGLDNKGLGGNGWSGTVLVAHITVLGLVDTVISLTFNVKQLVSWIIVITDLPEVLGSGGLGRDSGSGIVLGAHITRLG